MAPSRPGYIIKMDHHLEEIKELLRKKGLHNVDIDFGRQLFDAPKPFSYIRVKDKGHVIFEEKSDETDTYNLYARAKKWEKELKKKGVKSNMQISGFPLYKDMEGMIIAEKKMRDEGKDY